MTQSLHQAHRPAASGEPLLSVRDLRVTFTRHGEEPFTAVDGVSFDVRPGQTVGLVGESGCGKSVTSLDFLGYGLPVGSPSLGELLAQGKNNLTAPWLGITGFLVISIMLSLLVFIGESVRDAFDPRKTFA